MVWQKRYSPPGSAPGTLRPAPQSKREVQITAIHYNADHYQEESVTDLDAYLKSPPPTGVQWLNIDGLGNVSILEKIGQHFSLHALSLEDVLNIPQRPKLEDYDHYEFLILRVAWFQDMMSRHTEQVSLFLGDSYVLTFQEEEQNDAFEPVRMRLRQNRGRIRQNGPDYLAYTLLDAAIDSYFPVLEALGERLEALEDLVLATPKRETLEEIYAVRRALAHLRRALWPAREAVQAFSRAETPLITDPTRLFLRDCYDHVLQVLDVLESYRELASGLMEMYFSSQSHHMNEVMKVLTIIATLFIPLTFVAGLYGMNFDTSKSPWNMPELQWYWGYPFSLMLMAGLAFLMLAFFRRKGWF